MEPRLLQSRLPLPGAQRSHQEKSLELADVPDHRSGGVLPQSPQHAHAREAIEEHVTLQVLLAQGLLRHHGDRNDLPSLPDRSEELALGSRRYDPKKLVAQVQLM